MEKPLIVAIWIFIIGILTLAIIYFKDIIQPFVIAVIIWYIIFSLKKLVLKIKLGNYRLNESIATLISLTVTVITIWLIIEIFTININNISENIDKYNQNFKIIIIKIEILTGLHELDNMLVEQINQYDFDFQQLATDTLNIISSVISNLTLVFIYVVFLLFEEKMIPIKIKYLLENNSKKREINKIFKRINNAIATYLYVKFIVSFIASFLCYLILEFLNIDFPILWSFLIFIFHFIPYVGPIISTILVSLFAAFQTADLFMALWVFLPSMLIQFLVGNYIEPKIIGKSLNLSPLGVILSLSFWGSIWGIVGMLLAVPLTSLLVIILSNFPSTKGLVIVLSEKGDIKNFTDN